MPVNEAHVVIPSKYKWIIAMGGLIVIGIIIYFVVDHINDGDTGDTSGTGDTGDTSGTGDSTDVSGGEERLLSDYEIQNETDYGFGKKLKTKVM